MARGDRVGEAGEERGLPMTGVPLAPSRHQRGLRSSGSTPRTEKSDVFRSPLCSGSRTTRKSGRGAGLDCQRVPSVIKMGSC